jgi:hypothetical protein
MYLFLLLILTSLQRARKRYRLKYLFVQTEEKARIVLARRCYSLWKGHWARQLLWHERESKISAKKNFALVELKVKELEDCAREKEGLDCELQETREALARVQEALSLRAQEVSVYSKGRETLLYMVWHDLTPWFCAGFGAR